MKFAMHPVASLRITSLAFGLALAGCTLAPTYERPNVALPTQFKEGGTWQTAQPKDDAPRGAWWAVFGDPLLDSLERQIETSNPTLAAAAARYRQAVALTSGARSALFPSVSATVSETRARSASSAAFGVTRTDAASLNAQWEVDLFGKVRSGVDADIAAAQASASDLAAARLSLQTQLAQDYFSLRLADAQRALYDDTIEAYQRSLQLTRNRYAAGVVTAADVAQAQTQLASAQAQATDLGIQRAQLEHAIAVLVGKAPSELSIEPRAKEIVASMGVTTPSVPPVVPSTLLERRPDIAAAERRVASANATIGVARAAYFPSLTLGGSAGVAANSWSTLLSAPTHVWSIGPAAALTLLDFGARSSAVDQARASYDQNVASYRQTVLSAIQQVEDDLAALRILAEETEIQRTAAAAARESLRLAENQYKAGTVSYLNVVTAQASSLAAEQTLLGLNGRRLVASAALVSALGGDWNVAELSP